MVTVITNGSSVFPLILFVSQDVLDSSEAVVWLLLLHHFVERGRSIAEENPDIQPEMLLAVDEVLKTGEVMSSAAREFASDPCSSVKRGNMVS